VYVNRCTYHHLHIAQEGWHYEVATAPPTPHDAVAKAPLRLTYKGVVYNEMKGVYSSPDAVIGYATEAALFPDSQYSHSSGGDPLRIPSLTFDAFQAFHSSHYHPSNARVFFFGDDDPAVRLATLASHLAGFGPRRGEDIANVRIQVRKLPHP
jgi:Zn-dependent M16 (insulinase) family peptidase